MIDSGLATAPQSPSGTDNDLLLAILTDAGDWVTHDFILSKARYLSGHGITVNSRASELRHAPYSRNVECKTERRNGRVVSSYRLVTS